MTAPLFASPVTISTATHRATRSYADQRREFSLFNNVEIVGRGPQGWTIRATRAVAEGISRLGFDVYAGDIDTRGPSFVVRRAVGYRVVDAQGFTVDPSNDYRRVSVCFAA